MNAYANKELMQRIFSELSKGNDQPFIDAMAEDMRWIWMGSGPWSKTFDGKKAVLDELWSAVKTTLVPPYKVVAHRFIADDDYVVVEASGENKTPGGKTYNNKYCWVCNFSGGKIHELKEYMDTQLVTETFQN
ncbi:MAG: nuclear transport factor 2 family protein [Ginsengibacter sp.]